MEPTSTRLPATIPPAEVTSDLRAPNLVPAIVADLGIDTGWDFATGAPTGLVKDPRNIRLVPHY